MCPPRRSRWVRAHEGGALRPVRPARGAAGRGRAHAVAGRRSGARPRGRHLGQPERLGDAARLADLLPDRRAPLTCAPHAGVRHRRVGRTGRRSRHGIRAGRRGLRRQPRAQGRLRRVRRGARVGPRSQTRRPDVRRGIDDSPGGCDRAAGHRGRRSRPAGPHQRCRWRLRLVRHPTRQTPRRPRDRSRQRDQARLHAVGGRRRGHRLPPRRLHPHRRALRPDPRSRRAPIGVRLPPRSCPQGPISMRRWVDSARCCGC